MNFVGLLLDTDLVRLAFGVACESKILVADGVTDVLTLAGDRNSGTAILDTKVVWAFFGKNDLIGVAFDLVFSKLVRLASGTGMTEDALAVAARSCTDVFSPIFSSIPSTIGSPCFAVLSVVVVGGGAAGFSGLDFTTGEKADAATVLPPS